MRVFAEERLRFEFGPMWQVLKYDKHAIYLDGVEHLQEEVKCKTCGQLCGVGSDAVDFVGVYNGQPYFIEVKDFRGHERENRHRAQGRVATEVAIKVRDTLAGLLGASHREQWRPLIEPILSRAPKVVLWLEQDQSRQEPRRAKSGSTDLKGVLRRSLSWLNPEGVSVMNKSVQQIRDLDVTDLSDRVCGLWKLGEKKKKGNRNERIPFSRDEFASVWSKAPQIAGEDLKELCDKGILVRQSGATELYKPGTAWDKLLDEHV